MLWGISFFEPKIRTAQRNLHQNRKYFNPLPGAKAGFNYEKKTGGRKSRWTVPIMKLIIQFSCLSALSGLSGLKHNFCVTDMEFSGPRP